MQMVRDQIGKDVFPVHRLDRSTSGALVFALSVEAARALGESFSSGKVNKGYLAIVRGIAEEKLRLDYPLSPALDKKADKLARKNKPPQAAVTTFYRKASCELAVCVDKYPTSRYSLVRAEPETGRTHQIRRHLRHLGNPIIGDINYGSGKHNRFFQNTYKIRRLLLACTDMEFPHPRTRQLIKVQAPLAAEFLQLVQQLGWGEFID